MVSPNYYDAFVSWNRYAGVSLIKTRFQNVIESLAEVAISLNPDHLLVAACDNYISFKLQSFVDFFMQDATTGAVMYYKEDSLQELRRTGVATISNEIIEYMEEKPFQPRSSYAIPPFYIFPMSHIEFFKKFLDSGLSAESLGSYMSWYSKEQSVRAFLMPGYRLNLGDIESYLSFMNDGGYKSNDN